MRAGVQTGRNLMILVGLLLFLDTSSAMAGYKTYGLSLHRGRAFTSFAIGPAITFYRMHRELKEEVPGLEESKKDWWTFVGASRNYNLSMAYVFENGFILGGDIYLTRSRGMKGIDDMTQLNAPDNPGETFAIMSGPLFGYYPRPDVGWFILWQLAGGYSTLSDDAPALSLRSSTGYEWPAGPFGAFGMSLGLEALLTLSEENGAIPPSVYKSVHIPMSAMFNICFKAFWERR
ncbi:MAG: hypothetical protein JXR76_20110 [Deltaproteobacteria bacterium]|nr:hypothetical protein [Deltaproteobacteria bacterium]